MPGTVRQRLFHGDFVQYVIDSALGPLIVRRPPVNLLDEGAPVTLSFSPEHCVLLGELSGPRASGPHEPDGTLAVRNRS